jgi:hypothetical protein
MPDLKLLRIEEGDNQKVLVDKINSNFSDILTFGGGPYGKTGDQGPQGDPGQTGPAGSYGGMGSRGSIWTIGPTDPGLTGYINNDFWLNTRAGLGNPIYQFSDSGWNPYGFGLLSQDLFRVYPNIPTSSGNSSYNAYTLTSTNPSNYTLVLSDNSLVGTSSITNPQYSKVLIAIDGGATGKNLLEFSKSDYSSDTSFNTKTPRFYWTSTLIGFTKYYLSWKNGDSLFFDVPVGELKLSTNTNTINNSRYRSTGFNLNLSGSQGLSITTAGNFVMNFTSAGTLLLSNRNIKYLISGGGNRFEMPITFNFTNTLNSSLPPLWIESNSANSGNLAYRANVISSSVSRLFLAYTSSEIIFDVKANGEVWYNKRINSIQTPAMVTPTVVASALSVSNTNWYTVIPGAVYSGAGGTASQRISANNGTDFVIRPSTSGPSNSMGICLWTPATGGTGTNNNGGWLNMLNNYEAISFRVRTDSESKLIRFLGLNTSNTFTNSPISIYPQVVDLTSSNSLGVSHVDFTIMNIAGLGSTAGNRKWFSVYYSAYGGNISGTKCGILYNIFSTNSYLYNSGTIFITTATLQSTAPFTSTLAGPGQITPASSLNTTFSSSVTALSLSVTFNSSPSFVTSTLIYYPSGISVSGSVSGSGTTRTITWSGLSLSGQTAYQITVSGV